MKFNVVFFLSIMITIIFSLIELTDLNVKTFAIDDSESFSNYTNSKFNFSIQYPSAWNLTENKLHPELANTSSTIEITSPFEGSKDLLQEKFLININKLQENITFNEYVDNAINEFKNEYRDFKLISNNSTIIDNHNGTKLSYSYLAGIAPLSIKLIMNHNIISDGNKVYVLTFGTPPDKYYEYLSSVQKMVNSFKILDKK
ncbi:MAG TPA: PsbP-related protein [Nitrososphaeraceae archaeon]|nr:PsbP-related protein [Nitrososphaeraceae archaeon]